MFVIDRIMIIFVVFIFLTESPMSGSHVNVHASQNDGYHKDHHNCESCKRHCYCPSHDTRPYYNCPIEVDCQDLKKMKCCFYPETQTIEESDILAESESSSPEETVVRHNIEQACKVMILIWSCVIFLLIVLGIKICTKGRVSRRNRLQTGHSSSTPARIHVDDSTTIAPSFFLFNDVVNGPENVQQPLRGTADDDRLPSYEDACTILVDFGNVTGGQAHTFNAVPVNEELAAMDEPPPSYEECVCSKYMSADVMIDFYSTNNV